MRRLLALLAAPLLGQGALVAGPDSGETLKLDFRAAIRLAVDRNFEIRSEQFTPLIARASLLESRGVFDPALEVSFEHVEDEPTSLDLPDSPGAGREIERRDRYSAGVAGRLPLGTQYSLSLDSDGLLDDADDRDQFESFAGIRLTQPLLKDFGTDVNMAPIRIARAGVTISEWALRERVMDVVARTALTYNDLTFAIENLEVERRSLDLAKQLLADNTKRAEIGVMSPLDVTEARAEAASREEGVILARREMLDRENDLKRLVTDRTLDLLRLKLDVAPVQRLEPPAFTVEQSVAIAFENRPDYRTALLELQQRKIQVVVARNDVLPQVDLETSFGLNGVDRSVWESVTDAFEEQRSAWSAGVVVRIPFPNRSARGVRDARQFEVARALVDLKNLEQEIVVRIDNAAGQIETTEQRIQATRQARILAKERLDAEQERLGAGSTTTFVVLELQKDLSAAEAAELQALTDFNKAVINLEREAGLTLTRNRIELESLPPSNPAAVQTGVLTGVLTEIQTAVQKDSASAAPSAAPSKTPRPRKPAPFKPR